MNNQFRVFGISAIFSCVLFFAFFFLTQNNISTSVGDQETSNKEIQQYQYAGPWNPDMYEAIEGRVEDVPPLSEIKGGIVPHHLLAGHYAATFAKSIAEQKPSTIVLLSPNHMDHGNADIITSLRDWKTHNDGVMQTNRDLIRKVAQKSSIKTDEDVIAEEHGIYGLIPIFAKSLPEARIITFALRNSAATSTLERFSQALFDELPSDAVIISSIDFSHYQTNPVAKFHDDASINAIETFDFDRLAQLEIDSVPSLYVLLSLMEKYKTQKIGHALHTTSADIVANPAVKETTSYYTPFFIQGDPKEEKSVTILHFGDMMLDRNVKNQIDTHGEDFLFSTLAGREGRFFHGMDIVTANLEGPFAKHRIETSKEIAFRFDPLLIPMLKKYRFNLFTQANNHSYDMGKKAIQESKDHLDAAGIDWYGEQYTVDEDALLIKEINGRIIAFIGINDTNAAVDQDAVLALIQEAEEKAETTIMNVHWGQEYKEVSNLRQRGLVHAFIDAGVDMIVGHHPHVVQEVEVYKDKPIFYSLGNFVFDQYFSTPTQQSLGLGIVIKNGVEKVYVFPLKGERSKVLQMEHEEANDFIGKVIDNSRLGSYTITNFELNLAKSQDIWDN